MLKSSLIKHIGYNSLGEILSRIPILVAQLIIAKALGPAVFGVWSFVQLIVNYNNLSSFGFISAMSRQEPLALGEENFEKAEKIRSVVFSMVTVISLILALLLVIVAFCFKISALSHYRPAIIYIAGLLLAQQAFIYYQALLQNHLNFKHLSIGKILYGFGFLALTLFVVHKYGVTGLLLAWLLSFIFSIGYYAIAAKEQRPRFLQFDFTLMKKLFCIGFPLYVSALLKIGITSMDKFFVGLFLGAKALGFYNVSNILLMIIIVLSGLVSRVLSPYFLQQLGKSKDHVKLYNDYKTVCYVTNQLLAWISVGIATLLTPMVKLYLTRYTDGIDVGILLIFSGYFMGFVQMMYVLNTTFAKYRQMVTVSVVVLVAYASLLFGVRYLHIASIELFASICLLVWMLYALSLYLTASSHFINVRVLTADFFRVVIAPLILPCSAFTLCFYVQDKLSGLELALGSILQLFVLALIFLLFVYKRLKQFFEFSSGKNVSTCEA